MKIGTKARREFYSILDIYLKDNIGSDKKVLPRQLAEAVAILCPDIPIKTVRTLCTNYIIVLYYLIRDKKLDVMLPYSFVGDKVKKASLSRRGDLTKHKHM